MVCLPHFQELYQFPNPSQFIENIVIAEDGSLLLNTFDRARMHAFSREDPSNEPSLVAELPECDGLTGLAEVGPNKFAVSGGINIKADASFAPGTARVGVIDFGDQRDGNSPTLKIIASIPDAGLLNGMVALPKHPHTVLSVDSKTGRIYRVNTQTGDVDIAFQDDSLKPEPNPKFISLGVNGVKIFQDYLYVSNSDKRFLGRFKIDDVGNKVGDLEIIATLPETPIIAPDDFAVASDSTVYLTCHPYSLLKISPDGSWVALADGDSEFKLHGPTAIALSSGEKSAYIVTSGGHTGKGGQIVKIDF